jgi:hypothetical protein
VETLYLSKRNLATLLGKLDKLNGGEASSCTIVKSDHAHPVYPQSMRRITVTAVEDGDRYFSAVSSRVNLSRQTLTALLEQLDKRGGGEIGIEGMRIVAVPDAKYYGAHAPSSITPVGHVSSEPQKK